MKYEYKIDLSPSGGWRIYRRERTPGWFGPKRWRQVGVEFSLADADRFLGQVKLNDARYGCVEGNK